MEPFSGVLQNVPSVTNKLHTNITQRNKNIFKFYIIMYTIVLVLLNEKTTT